MILKIFDFLIFCIFGEKRALRALFSPKNGARLRRAPFFPLWARLRRAIFLHFSLGAPAARNFFLIFPGGAPAAPGYNLNTETQTENWVGRGLYIG